MCSTVEDGLPITWIARQRFSGLPVENCMVLEKTRRASATIERMSKHPPPNSARVDRKKRRDKKIATLSIDLVPPKSRRIVRIANQVLLAGELNEAITLCLKQGLLMPIASLLRSLIDTTVLGLWFVKYSPEDQVTESVSDFSTTELISGRFDEGDKKIFAFLFQPVRGTDHYFYRDVLHSSVHGDAFHLAMQTRDEASRKTWIFNCSFQANSVYCHFLLQFAKTERVPDFMKEVVKKEAAKCIRWQKTILEHPQFKGTNEYLSV